MTTADTIAPELVSVGRRLTDLAHRHPTKTALIFSPRTGADVELTWRDLDRRSNQFARYFADAGVDEQSTVVIGLPNSIEQVIAWYGVWKLGATTLPLRWDMPDRERDALLELANPSLIIADWDVTNRSVTSLEELRRTNAYDEGALPDRTPSPGKTMASGGSTGRPKIIARTGSFAFPPGAIAKLFAPFNFQPGMTSLVTSPLYHEGGFSPLVWGHFEGCTVVLVEQFDPEDVLRLIETYGVQFVNLVPIMMQRLLDVPDVASRDLSSVVTVAHAAAPCAPWLKQAWIELVGPERVKETLMATEGNGLTIISGEEWLDHPGSVGKPYLSEIKILDEQQNEVPAGEVGLIYGKSALSDALPFHYVGSDPAPSTPDGFSSVGDLGWLDEDGYLYLADRRTDLIISGGANVFAAEVEAVLSEHPGVADVVVVGLPDETWGKRVHAVIQRRDSENRPGERELDTWCRERMSVYKCPKTYEFLAQLPRTDAGKIRRSALASERS